MLKLIINISNYSSCLPSISWPNLSSTCSRLESCSGSAMEVESGSVGGGQTNYINEGEMGDEEEVNRARLAFPAVRPN